MRSRTASLSSRRDYSRLDRLLILAQGQLARRLAARPAAVPSHPGRGEADVSLDATSRRRVAGLMRVNHAGEVAAQALYRGQALLARDSAVRAHLLSAAAEERAHLAWCAERLRELDDRPSVLTPVWFAGSYAIGAAAALAGDRASLGFVEETERQVCAHLDDHLGKLPAQDQRSRAILKAMREDERRHGQDAHAAGGRRLPGPVRRLMAMVAGVMKFGAYRV